MWQSPYKAKPSAFERRRYTSYPRTAAWWSTWIEDEPVGSKSQQGSSGPALFVGEAHRRSEAETEAEVGSSEPLCSGEAELPSDTGHLPHVHLEKSRSGSTHCRKELGKTPWMLSYRNVYLSRSEGGLGLPEFSKSIPAQRINALSGICRSSDFKIRRMTEVMQTPIVVEKIADRAGLTVPETPKGRVRWRRLVSIAAQKLNIGQAAQSFQFTESNTWLNPSASYFSESDYIARVALRYDTYPRRVTLARGRQGVDVCCRHCHLTAETVGHISGACPRVKDYRIRRHSRLCIREMPGGWSPPSPKTLWNAGCTNLILY